MAKICFVHIPKTAGSSLRKMLKDNYHPDEVFNGNTMLDYQDKTKEDMEKYKLFLGHIFYYKALEILPEDTRYITLLRNPVDRVISLYYFWRKHTDEYINNKNIPEIIRKGPRLAKENNLIDFLKLDDPFVVQSTTNNQILQLMTERKGHDSMGNPNEAFDSIVNTLNSYDVVGVQELFSFFVFKFNKKFRKHGIFFSKIEEKNKAERSASDDWNAYSQSDKQMIKSVIKEKNKLEMRVYKKVYNRNMLEINNFFSNKIVLPQIYS